MEEMKTIIENSSKAVADAYSKLTGGSVSLDKVGNSPLSFSTFLEEFSGDPEKIVIVVYFLIYRLTGDTNKEPAGYALVSFDSDSKEFINEDKRSYLAEVANISIGAYLSSLSDLTVDNFRVSTPIQAVVQGNTQTVSDTLRYQLFKGDLDKELSLTTIGLQKNNQISSTISSLAGGVGEVSLYIFIK